MRTLGIAAAALVFSALVFLVGLHFHFPGIAARDRLAWQLQDASKGAWLLEASDASLYRGTGLSLDDVILFKQDIGRHRGRGEKETPAVPILRIETAAARLKLLPLLRGHKAGAFALDLYGGSLSGEVDLTSTTQNLSMDGHDIDLSRIPLEGEDWVVDATGKLSVSTDLSLSTVDVQDSTGDLRIEIADMVFTQATIMGMSLEPTPFSQSVLSLEIDKGKAQIKDGRFASDPVDITVSGDIVLNKSLARSRLKIKLLVRFSDQFDRLARMAPGLSSARDDDGVYHFRVTGTLQSPRFRQDRGTSRSRTLSSPKEPRRSSSGNDNGAKDDAAARRAERLERIRNRRKLMSDRQKMRPNMGQPGMPPMPAELGSPPQELGLPGRAIRRRFQNNEDVLDTELRDDPNGQGLPPQFDDRLPPMDDGPPFDEEQLPDPSIEEQQFNGN